MNRPLLRFAIPTAVILGLLVAAFFQTGEPAAGDFFMPHAHCYLFNRNLMRLHGGSDLLIGLAYVAISATLTWLVYRVRRELPFHWMMIAFAIFILACGATHFMEVWTLTAEHPRYWLSGWVKAITAAASVTTAVVLPPLVPRILDLLKSARLSAERHGKLERAYRELNERYVEDHSGDLAGMVRELAKAKEAAEAKTEELAQQREWFRVTLSSIGDAVITTDTKAKVTFLNPVAEGLTGWKSGDARGQPLETVFAIINEETRQPVLNPVGKALREGAVVGLANHTALIAKDGREIPIEDSAAPIRDAGGAILGAVMVFHDVTEGRSTRRALLESEGRLNLAMEAAQMGAWEWVMASGKVTWSPSLEAIHGLQPGTFGGTFEDFQKHIHPEDREHVLVRIRESVERREDYRVEYRNIKPDGRLSWIEARGKLFMADKGHPERMAGICMDITARKQAEESLRESDERFRALGDSIAQLAWAAHPDGFIYWYNRRWYEYTGTTPEQMEGWGWQSVHDPAVLPVVLEKWRTAIAVGQPFEMEFPLRGADGIFRTFLTRAIPRCDASGRVLQWCGTNTDISSRIESENMLRETAEALRAARDSAEAASRAKDEFLAALSHELRTPLTPVLVLAAEMEHSVALPEPVRADFAMIRRNVELEARIIDDLLDLTRITHGKLTLRFESVDAHASIEHVLAILRSDSEAKSITVTLELRADGHHVSGDAVRLQQVFWNVLKNAIKFTPEGGGITIRSSNEDGHLRIATSDTGLGITPEELPRIFTAFEQGREAEAPRFGGLGLGLSITALLVREHRGRIWAESAGRNQGSTFHVELPLADAPMLGHLPTPSADLPSTRLLRILLVEDHEDTRGVLQRLMTRWGHGVTGAASVAEAREAIADGAFDLLLSDVGLPDGTGYDVIAAFREKSDAPAVAMSGYGMEADLARTKAAGFTEHIVKPVSADALRDLLRRDLPPAAGPG